MQRKSVLISMICIVLSFSQKVFTAHYPSVPGEFIVKMKQGLGSAKSIGNMKSIGARPIDPMFQDLLLVDGGSLLSGTEKNANTNVWTDGNIATALKKLRELPGVEYVEPNYIYRAIDDVFYGDETSDQDRISQDDDSADNEFVSDPLFKDQWGMRNIKNPGLDINIINAWNIEQGNREIIVGVIDSGIDYNHPDLRDNMWINNAEYYGKENVDDDKNGYIDDIYGYNFIKMNGNPMDDNSHGTHCAGVIGAVHNDIGVAGVMRDVRLMALKFLASNGNGSLDDAVKAIAYAVKMKVNILSNSWGGGPKSKTLEDAIKLARSKGIIFIAAAGNDGQDNDRKPHYPSSYDLDNILSVAAYDDSGLLARFSNYGRASVDIAAPGYKILSTVPNNGYKTMSGTSMSTPFVSGIVGLYLSQQNKSIAPKNIISAVMNSSQIEQSFRVLLKTDGRIDSYNLLSNINPARIRPKVSSWKAKSLSSLGMDNIETSHPYTPKYKVKKTIKIPDAKFIRLEIEKLETEEIFDQLVIRDSKGVVVEEISGKKENYVTNYVEGDTLELEFIADVTTELWGFQIKNVQVNSKLQ